MALVDLQLHVPFKLYFFIKKISGSLDFTYLLLIFLYCRNGTLLKIKTKLFKYAALIIQNDSICTFNIFEQNSKNIFFKYLTN